jgi:hypothetical protein
LRQQAMENFELVWLHFLIFYHTLFYKCIFI